MEKFKANNEISVSSSTDESEPEQGDFDVEGFNEDHHRKYSVIKSLKSNKTPNKNSQNRRRKLSKRSNRQNDDEENEIVSGRNSQQKNHQHRSRQTKKVQFIDMNVYNFSFPRYAISGEEDVVEEVKVNDENVDEKKTKKKRAEKVKKLRKRKELEAMYERCHDWYKDINKTELPDIDHPSASIPSYKVEFRARHVKGRTVKLALDKVLAQTFKAVDDIEKRKLRKEATRHSQYIILNLADHIVGEIEESTQRDSVRYAIDLLLDKWESHIYMTRKTIIEQQLEKISETLVTSAIMKTVAEVENEDRIATLVVRDSLAGALDELGKNKMRISRALHRMYAEYDFDDYNFDKGKTKIKQRVYKRRGDLDGYLRKRAEHLKDTSINDNSPRRKKRERRNPKTKDLTEIVEEKKEKENENVEECEEELRAGELVCLSDEYISGAEENQNIAKHTSLDKYNKVVDRERRRSRALVVWKDTDKQILLDLRHKNDQWNALYEKRQEEEEETKLEKQNEKQDLNALYAMSEEEEEEALESEDEFHRMPNLNEIVNDALINPDAEIIVVPVKQGFKRAPPSDDSAVDTDAERENSETRLRKTPVIGQSPSVAVPRRDTGISSIATTNDEPLIGNSLEKEISAKEFISLIPTLDRNEFLNDWLTTSGTLAPKRIPTPPSNDRQPRRVRKFHLKRPSTAESVASIRDIVPIDNKTYFSNGRLNSAKSTRSGGRPESAHSIYSERSSLHSRLEDRPLSSEIESDEDEKAKMIKSARNTEHKPRNTKIEFHRAKPRSGSNTNAKHEKDVETTAWNFYLRQNRELRKLQQKIEEEGCPQLLEDFPLPEIYISESEVRDILDGYGDLEINGMYNDEEEEIELLRIAENRDSSSDDDDGNKAGRSSNKHAPSVSPPPTPWRRQKKRPLTPDSVDSDEELEKIKKKHYEEYQRKVKGPPRERLYKEFLRKKDTSLPPPPIIGWQPTQGLIKWKQASEGKIFFWGGGGGVGKFQNQIIMLYKQL